MIVPDTLCNDTLCVDTLCQAESQDTVIENLVPFEYFGILKDSSLMHTEIAYKSFGFEATATPFRIRFNEWSGVLLLVCLILAASLILRLRKNFVEVLRGVFLPIPGKKEEPLVDDPLRYSTRLIAVGLLSLTAAMVTFTYTQHEVEYYSFPETPYILFGAFFLLWIVYFLMKRMMSSFVNWIFFRSEKIFTMHRAYTFLYVVEAMLSLAFAMIVVYLPIPHDKIMILAFALIIFVKILLLFKTYQIFFPKMYGTLHLIVYFCTLELMPLLVIQQVLTYADYLSVIKI